MVPRLTIGAVEQRRCPGCGLTMPMSEGAAYEGYYNTSPECWSIYAEVLGREYDDRVLLSTIHSLSVDAYAVQHAGGSHPTDSVGLHLAGLYLVLERDVKTRSVPLIQGRLGELVTRWPDFSPPDPSVSLTVYDAAVCESNQEYMMAVRSWATSVWDAWSEHHATIAHLVSRHVPLPVSFRARPAAEGGDLAALQE